MQKNDMIYIIFAPLVLSTMGCNSNIEKSKNTSDEYSSSIESFDIDDKKLREMEYRSLQGDMDSLDSVVQYYSYSARGFDSGLDRNSVLKWTEIGASFGEKKHMANFLFYAQDSDIDCKKIRSIYHKLIIIDKKYAQSKLSGRVDKCIKEG